MNSLKDVIKKRRSIRQFQDREVPFEIVKDLIETASWAPSACNLQAWEFVFIDDKEIMWRIVKEGEVNKQILRAPALLVAMYDKNVTKEHSANIQSCAAAIQNFLLLATEQGLGTVWICNFHNTEGIKKVLNAPDRLVVVALISIGYPQRIPNPPKRRSCEEFLHYNIFEKKNEIPSTTYLKDWNLQQIFEYQKRISRRGYELEKFTHHEKEVILPLIFAELAESDIIIEILSHSGNVLVELSRNFKHVIGHFLSDDVKYAAQQFRPELYSIEYIVTENLNFEEATVHSRYDAAIIYYKLEHLPYSDCLTLFKNVFKMLKKNGKFIVITRNRYSWYGLYDFLFRNILRKKSLDDNYLGSLRMLGPWELIGRRKVKRLFYQTGFSLLKVMGRDVTPFYRFAESEAVRGWPIKIFKLIKIIVQFVKVVERIFDILHFSNYLGETLVFVGQRK